MQAQCLEAGYYSIVLKRDLLQPVLLPFHYAKNDGDALIYRIAGEHFRTTLADFHREISVVLPAESCSLFDFIDDAVHCTRVLMLLDLGCNLVLRCLGETKVAFERQLGESDLGTGRWLLI